MKYVIQKGDTLSGIAKMFGTTVDDIMAANPKIQNRDLIYAGDTIDVPVNVFKGVTDVFKGWWNTYVGAIDSLLKKFK